MSDLQTSTALASSSLAHSFAMPTPVPADTDDVELRILYDPFKPEEVEVHQLVFEEGKTLGEYLGDLDPEQTWMVFHNGVEVEDYEAEADRPVAATDSIGILLVPQGGDGFKSVLRIVMQAAAVALAFVPGVGWAAALAINVAVGLANAFLLTPKPPKTNNDQEERAYGIDGAKNSATEGIVYPVVYGEYRVAGNFCDSFTVNQGDDQYLYLRSILNDGLINSVSDIEVNEQPIENFKQVSARIALGELDQPANDWFNRSVVQVNKSAKLDTSWVYHTTTGEVDKLRFDVVFTQGLVTISEKKGTYSGRSVTFECQYREVDPVTKEPIGGGSWSNMGIGTPEDYFRNDYTRSVDDVFGARFTTDIDRVTLHGRVSPLSIAENTPRIQYRPVGSSTWQNVPGEWDEDTAEQDRYIYDDANDGTISGPTNATPSVGFTRDFDLTPGQYEFRGVDGAVIEQATGYPTSGSNRYTVSDSRTRQIRKSFETSRVNRGYYETRIRRTTPTSTNKYILDEVFLSDVGEIGLDKIRLSGVANIALKIKLNDQLNQIPTLSAKVRGCVLQEYDKYGNPTVKRWSANPAWIALDILLSQERGAQYSKSRIDWPAWVRFAQYCDDNNLTYNGVFVTAGALGEAYREVMRVGHAMPVPLGTKLSVAIDCPRKPKMLFGKGNIIEKSMNVAYMGLKERANDFEVQYFDRNDGNKQKSIRYVDQKAVTFNETPRKASVTLKGVDNIEQARAELWRMIYSNRLLLRTVTLEAPLEAIGLNIGDVAIVEAPSVNYSESGRIKRSLPGGYEFEVPEKLSMVQGETIKLLVHIPSVNRSPVERTVASVVGRQVMLDASEGALTGDEQNEANRIVEVGGKDYEIDQAVPGATYHTITLVDAAHGIQVGDKVGLWQNDDVAERTVEAATEQPGGATVLRLASSEDSLGDVTGSNYAFGVESYVRREMALTGVAGEGIERRTLTFTDYDERIYAAGEVDIPIPTVNPSERKVRQVRNLLVDYENISEPNRGLVNVRAHWDASQVINYGGSDIYASINGAAYRRVGTATGATEFQMQAQPGDHILLRVVPFNLRGDRASYIKAKTVSVTLEVEYASLDAPVGVSATSVAFEVDGTVELDFAPPADPTGIQDYEVQYKRTVDQVWISHGYVSSGPVKVSGLPTGSYEFRVRSNSKTSTSVWVEDEVTVVVVPGSLMANWNSSNDRNATPVLAPTLPASGVVEHTLNRDGSANISFEWEWGGDEAEIDGFIVNIENTPPS